MFGTNFLCSILDHLGNLLFAFTWVNNKKTCTQRELSYYTMKRYIVSISHAMIMTHDLSHRINRIIHKDMASILRAMNLLRDVLRFHYTNAKLISPNLSQNKQPICHSHNQGCSYENTRTIQGYTYISDVRLGDIFTMYMGSTTHMTRGVLTRPITQLGVYLSITDMFMDCVPAITRTIRGVPSGSIAQLGSDHTVSRTLCIYDHSYDQGCSYEITRTIRDACTISLVQVCSIGHTTLFLCF